MGREAGFSAPAAKAPPSVEMTGFWGGVRRTSNGKDECKCKGENAGLSTAAAMPPPVEMTGLGWGKENAEVMVIHA